MSIFAIIVETLGRGDDVRLFTFLPRSLCNLKIKMSYLAICLSLYTCQRSLVLGNEWKNARPIRKLPGIIQDNHTHTSREYADTAPNTITKRNTIYYSQQKVVW